MLDNYKIIKELNKGASGITYLVKKNNKIFVIKRQKIFKDEIKVNYLYRIWREIDFGNFINKMSLENQKYFMKIYKYKVLKCDYKHIPFKFEKINDKFIKENKSRNNSKYCLDLLVEYKYDIAYELFKNNDIPLNEKYCFMIQILYAIEIMRTNNYLHYDIHLFNITYKNTQKPIKFFNKKLPCKNQYSLIDYGSVKNPKYFKKKEKINYYKNLIKKNFDVFKCIMLNIILNQNLLEKYYLDNNLKIPKLNINDNLFSFLKETTIWQKIKKILYKNNEEWFDTIENEAKIIKNWFLIDRIYALFSAFNRKKYLKIVGWNKDIPNFLPDKDIIFMVENITDNNKMIKYFLKKFD